MTVHIVACSFNWDAVLNIAGPEPFFQGRGGGVPGIFEIDQTQQGFPVSNSAWQPRRKLHFLTCFGCFSCWLGIKVRATMVLKYSCHGLLQVILAIKCVYAFFSHVNGAIEAAAPIRLRSCFICKGGDRTIDWSEGKPGKTFNQNRRQPEFGLLLLKLLEMMLFSPDTAVWKQERKGTFFFFLWQKGARLWVCTTKYYEGES